ncbi:transcription factor SPT20 homolog [Dendronephthya gigantea]|uniref:transcription factor SPT20 homolog n=1 Tax=Dendronephthya gigantea TaxID=151771 RepID=UPI00106C9DC5|nr:transcription factor SPT20 homolog [Dendronephthya gigantea]
MNNMDSCLKLVPRNCYNTYSSVVLALFVAIGVVLLTIASVFEAKSSLKCDLNKRLASTIFKGKYIEAGCLLKYAEQFLPSLPLTAFIAISFGLVVVCSVVYGYLVKHRVDIFTNNPSITTNEGVEESQPVAYQRRNRYLVFMAYVIHLIVCRMIPLTIFSAFLLTSSNFPTHFECPLPNMKTTTSTSHENVTGSTTNSSFVDCTYSMAGKKQQVVAGFITINFLVDAATLVEIVYLLWSAWKRPTFKTDQEFITLYLEKKHAEATPNTSNPYSSYSPNQKANQEIHEITRETNSNSPNQEVNQEIHEITQKTNSNSPNQEANQEIHEITQETNSNSPNQEANQEIHETTQETNSNSPNQEVNKEISEITQENKSNSPNQEANQEIHEMIQENKTKRVLTVNILEGKRKLDKIDINVIIQVGTECVNYSRRKILKDRHEIDDIQLEKPPSSKVLESTAEFFQAEKAGKKPPRTVLVVGRPGIGKTLLTEKILRLLGWQESRQHDEFWYEKID